jgi:Lysophospholipase L1 and related esterases
MSDFEKVRSYLVSGDSISRGIVYDEGKGGYSVSTMGYVSLVQERLGGIVRNVSRFGNTLSRGAARLARDIEKERPDIVLIEYGGNDCDFAWPEVAERPDEEHLPQTDLELFEKTLSGTVSELKAEGIEPVLMSLPPLDADRYVKWVSKGDPEAERNIVKWLGSVTKIYWWQERYSAAVVRVAERTSAKWIDVRGAFLRRPDFPSLLCRDGIHPNEGGQRLIADTILEYVEERYPALLRNEELCATVA